MIRRLGTVGELLETAGQLSGHEYRLLDGPGPELVGDRSGWSCRLPVALPDAPECLLQAGPAPASAETTKQEACVARLLELAKALVDERHQMTAENTRLTEELSQTYEELHLFSRIATQIRSVHFSQSMLDELLREIVAAMRVDLAAACFPQQPENNAVLVAPPVKEKLTGPAILLERLMATMPDSAPAFDGGSRIVNCSRDLPVFSAMHSQPFRALAVKIECGANVYGWLLLVSFNMDEIFRRGEHRLLRTMAEQIALVMTNTELYRDLESFVINLVRTLVMTIEAKDLYTKGHSERVSGYCMRMGAALGLDEEDRNDLQWASVLHDLGKIGTQERILNKTSRLSTDEFEHIKQHPVLGATILEPVEQLAGALPAIRHHHERFDGGGYPDGLVGETIPRLARIIAVADTYDALTSDRAYRSRRSHEEAMQVIETCAGSQLDMEMCRVFQRVVNEDAAESCADVDLGQVARPGAVSVGAVS